MADETTGAPGAAPEGAEQQGGNQPMMLVNAQYVKDLSFENPNAPQVLIEQRQEAPNVQIAVDVDAQQFGEKVYEVTLQVRAEGTAGQTSLFIVEVAYAGIFSLGEVPDDYLAPLLYIEAPRQLFPFARNIVADCVRDGGFPQLLIQPVDFVQLYQQRAAQAKAQQDQAGQGAAPAAGGNGDGTSGNSGGNGSGKDKPDDKKFEFEL